MCASKLIRCSDGVRNMASFGDILVKNSFTLSWKFGNALPLRILLSIFFRGIFFHMHMLLPFFYYFLEGIDWESKLDKESCMVTGTSVKFSFYICSLV
jgi:hypothetical protein